MINQSFLCSQLQALFDIGFISAESKQTRAGLIKRIALYTPVASCQFKMSLIYNLSIDYKKRNIMRYIQNTD
jgi:hypothetical protein